MEHAALPSGEKTPIHLLPASGKQIVPGQAQHRKQSVKPTATRCKGSAIFTIACNSAWRSAVFCTQYLCAFCRREKEEALMIQINDHHLGWTGVAHYQSLLIGLAGEETSEGGTRYTTMSLRIAFRVNPVTHFRACVALAHGGTKGFRTEQILYLSCSVAGHGVAPDLAGKGIDHEYRRSRGKTAGNQAVKRAGGIWQRAAYCATDRPERRRRQRNAGRWAAAYQQDQPRRCRAQPVAGSRSGRPRFSLKFPVLAHCCSSW